MRRGKNEEGRKTTNGKDERGRGRKAKDMRERNERGRGVV